MNVAIYVTRVTRVNEFMRADDVDPRCHRVRNAGPEQRGVQVAVGRKAR